MYKQRDHLPVVVDNKCKKDDDLYLVHNSADKDKRMDMKHVFEGRWWDNRFNQEEGDLGVKNIGNLCAFCWNGKDWE